jgi:hypothetical protein
MRDCLHKNGRYEDDLCDANHKRVGGISAKTGFAENVHWSNASEFLMRVVTRENR